MANEDVLHEDKIQEPGKPALTEPLLIPAKHEDGRAVQIDIMHLLATDQNFRKTAEAAFRKWYKSGFPANYVMQVALVITDTTGIESNTVFVLPAFDRESVNPEMSSPELWKEEH